MNDQVQMTNDQGSAATLRPLVIGHWEFVIHWALGIGHWSLLWVRSRPLLLTSALCRLTSFLRAPAQGFQSFHSRRVAAFESKLFKDVGQVFFDGEFGRAKDGADV